MFIQIRNQLVIAMLFSVMAHVSLAFASNIFLNKSDGLVLAGPNGMATCQNQDCLAIQKQDASLCESKDCRAILSQTPSTASAYAGEDMRASLSESLVTLIPLWHESAIPNFWDFYQGRQKAGLKKVDDFFFEHARYFY